jgi:hypothetical protein
MAAANVVISGMMYHGKSGESTPVTIVGIAGLAGLEVGYPLPQPPAQPGVPGSPTFPIWGPPGFNPPGAGYPPGIWGGPIIPAPPTEPPANPSEPKPPPDGGGWGWHPTYGWGFFPMTGGKPQPPG